MRAIVIDRFGGIEELHIREVPLPQVGLEEVLIRVETAGVGSWDPFEREGGYAQMLGTNTAFPYVLGSEGAGEIVEVGQRVHQFQPGDKVYAAGFLNPKGGFYAEYVAVRVDLVSSIPKGVSSEQAGVVAGAGLTALRGLDDALMLRSGESVMVFGAGGGVGHLAVQLAKRMGARVVAVASGQDGVALAEKLGADVAVDGRQEDAGSKVKAFTKNGLDAALLTAGGEGADKLLSTVRDGGRIAYPNGIEPLPLARAGLQVTGYNGEPDSDILSRLNRLIEAGPFEVHIARTFSIEQVADAHRALDGHYLGKLALKLR